MEKINLDTNNFIFQSVTLVNQGCQTKEDK